MMHRRRFPFSAPPMSGKERKLRGRRGTRTGPVLRLWSKTRAEGKVMSINITKKKKALAFAHAFLHMPKYALGYNIERSTILLLLCFYSFVATYALSEAEEIVEIDGVEYCCLDAQRFGASKVPGKCVLGRSGLGCAVNIPDDRKRLYIPKTIKGKQVVKIEIEEIVLPNGINEIGENAFRECWALKRINIPSSVHTIGGSTFKDCEKLEGISLPANVKLGHGLFENCSSLERFLFPKGIRVPYGYLNNGVWNNGVPNGMFKGCTALKTIVIPSDFTKIGAYAFAGCSGLINIDIPPAIISVGNGAFCECLKLETINLPESVAEIGGAAFNGCINLKAIKLPFRITKIEGGPVAKGGVFGNCKSLTTIAIPENVEEIGMYAFLDCSSLQTVSFSPIMQKIRVTDAAFSGCTSLKEIILPRSIAASVLDKKFDYRFDSKKLRDLPGLKITYLD